jgi:hypothetical protein
MPTKDVFSRASKENPRREIRVWRSSEGSYDVRIGIAHPDVRACKAVVVLDVEDVNAVIDALRLVNAGALEARVFA